MKKHILFLFILCSGMSIAQTGFYINTLAGTGNQNFSGDGGPATQAELSQPCVVTVDKAGNIYFIDSGSNRVRKVSATGVINTVAGNGTYSYTGDGGQATNAGLGALKGLAVDTAGNIYVSDCVNHVIRKINTLGIISTFAGTGAAGYTGNGGQANLAKLNAPSGLATDTAGNLFVADSMNHVIRKINAAGIISTVAGNGSPGFSGTGGNGGLATAAQLYLPGCVTVDHAGNLYLNDWSNSIIRKVSAGGIISAFAGTPGMQGFSGDGGAATSAKFWHPMNITSDFAGNIYISDDDNVRIRKVNTSGIVSTIAGNGVYGSSAGDGGLAINAAINGPLSLAMDSSNNLVLADIYGNKIRRITYCNPFTFNSISSNSPICGNASLVFTTSVSGPGPVTYSWTGTGTFSSQTAASPTVTNATTGVYTLSTTNACNIVTSTISVVVSVPPVMPFICLVSADANSINNVVHWDQTQYPNADSFIVYRYDIIQSNYQRIGATNGVTGSWADTARGILGPNGGDPNFGSYRYKLAIKDPCGTIGQLSPYHQTSYVQQNTQNFSWNAYVVESGQTNPVTGYQLMRDNNGTGSWQSIASVTGTSSQDPAYLSYPNGGWRVDVYSFNCPPLTKSSSNILGNHGFAIPSVASQSRLALLFPNPACDKLIVSPENETEEIQMEITDITGKSFFLKIFSGKEEIDISSFTNGFYFVNLKNKNSLVSTKLVVSH